MFFDVLIIVVLILLNGVFAMTELAVVSSRRSRLLAKAEQGHKGAAVVLELKEDPSKFLSTVQIGITLIGIFAGAFSGVTIAEPLGEDLRSAFPSLNKNADEVAFILVVSVVTYLSLVVGELVPKQIALRYADRVAIAIALPIFWLSKVTKPLVHLLDVSNQCLLRLLRVPSEGDTRVSEEEVIAIIGESTESGALEPEEKQMMERVMRLDDITVGAAMTHRSDIVWLDVSTPRETVLDTIRQTMHSRYLLCEDSIENVLGIITLKELSLQLGAGALDLRAIRRKPFYMPETKTLLDALEEFKQSTAAMAVIVDEYGGLQGVLTLKDIMEAIVGTLPEPAHREDYAAIPRDDGSWLVDGGYPLHEAEATIGLKGIATGSAGYSTMAGFLLHELRRIPREGEWVGWREWRLEVVDMDGTRIDKLLVRKP